jgi:complement component 1 Q subcomponent-binding protein, mitochondrial
MASRTIFRSFKSLSKVKIPSNTATISKSLSIQSAITKLPQITSVRTYASDSNNNAYSALTSFLKEEIKFEKENQQFKNKLPTIPGFDVQTDGPNVTFTRTYENEKISVKFSVNESLNEEESPEGSEEKSENVNVRSKPPFTIDILRNNKTLSFECAYLGSEYGEDKPQNEDFEIVAFAIHDGDWNDKVYAVDASIMDGDMYDILLKLLEERGIGEQFANQLMEFSTAYEHRQYVGLLDKLQDFIKQ